MKICKKCGKVISVTMEEFEKADVKEFGMVTKESEKVGMCAECFRKAGEKS